MELYRNDVSLVIAKPNSSFLFADREIVGSHFPGAILPSACLLDIS